MKLKHFIYSIACLISVISLASCNSENEYVVDGDQSPEGRIVSFTIDARPFTAMDSITYPALKTRKFTIENRGVHHMFNADSLPMYTDIRSLKLNIQYASNNTHGKTDLVYPKDSTDYPTEWNELDSVKFFKLENGLYYPQLKVIAQNGYERIYTINFNIHEQDPDSIKWHRVKNNDVDFNLEKQGETKVVLNSDKSKFIAFINDKINVFRYTSLVETSAWLESASEATTTLPSNILVNSLQTIDGMFVVITDSGISYTSNDEGITWTKHDEINIQSIVGLLPEAPSTKSTPLNEFLITYLDDKEILHYAKTSDFITPSKIILGARGNDLVIDGFPMYDYTALQRTTGNETHLVTIAGNDNNDKFVKKTWIIKNLTPGNPAEISIMPTSTNNFMPFDSKLTAFIYDDMIYSVSSESLSLYTSRTGDVWLKTSEKQKLDTKMADMNMPSVVVDKDNYMWIFGGVSSKGTPVYSQQIWKGKINRLSHKRQVK